MPNQKGSVKDRIRALLLFLQYKRIRKKQEKEILKRKKKLEKERIKAEQIRLYGRCYSKLQVFGLTILGLFVGALVPKSSSKKITNELEIIEKSIKQIVQKLEQDKEIEKVYQDIDNTYQKLENLKLRHSTKMLIDSFNLKNQQSLLKTVVQKQKELHVLNEICHIKEKQNMSKEKIASEKKDTFQNENKISSMSNHLEEEKVGFKSSFKINNATDFKLPEKKVGFVMEPLGMVKKMNLDLKEYEKELEFLKKKVEDEKSYHALFDYEFKLKQLKIRIQKVLEDYEMLKHQVSLEVLEDIIDIDVIDKYELRKNEKKVVEKTKQCQILLQEIEEKKALLSSKASERQSSSLEQEQVKQEKKQLIESQKIKEKKEQKKKEKEKMQEQFDEFYLANKMIAEHIIKETKMIEKFKRQLSHQSIVVRKRSIFFYAKKITSSILTFGISLLPFRYFKNRLMGTLVSGIMINNSLRSIRRVVATETQEITYLYYANLAKEVCSNQDYIYHIYKVCQDSLSQVKEIREHLSIHYSMVQEYDSELLSFYQDLDKLEKNLSSQISDLQVLDKQYDIMKQKIKVRDDC